MKIKITSCCSLPVDENGYLIEIPENENTCPNCEAAGKLVDEAILKSFLLPSLREIRKTPYFFCGTRACPVVYFSSDGEQTFTREQIQIREQVYQKEPEAAY
ncbi:MAG: hypothetical protein L0287_04555 [Anaerolineae bacterium]|nr:hypothetical protein [Anaerolineae bacterium]MCI0610178.1 hypothetical protein [Anaerolineae bacterium]